jgi:hypothetical protein
MGERLKERQLICRPIDYPIQHFLSLNCIIAHLEFHHCELVAWPSPESRAPFRFRDVGLEASLSDWSGQ